MSNVSILIIEDEAVIAEDIKSTLIKLNYDVAAIIGRSEKAIDYLSFNSPDLVLCDIRIKGEKDGIQIAEQFQISRNIPFIFLTSLADRGTLERAKKVMPYGYIVKPFNDRDILSAIEIASYKHSQEIEKLVISRLKINSICSSNLTEKEYELLLEITKGSNNKKISEQHFISINTVKFHLRNLFSKLDVSNRAEALHKIIDLLTQ